MLRVISFLSAAFLASSLFAAPAGRPNVILVMTDDQGYGDLSVHGNPVLKTPHLDRLHSESVRLTDFHAAPMCTPTRGQLLTGIDALRNGAMNVSSGRTLLRTEYPSMAEIFKASGYRTGVFGKWHLGDNYPYRPQDRGFDESIWLASSHTPAASDYWNNDYFDDVYWRNGRREPFHGYCTDVFFDAAMNWMRDRHQNDEPFFCYLPTNTPHGPLFVPDHYREPYQDQPRAIASFFGMIANIDENMGRLETFLKQTGLRDNTILIFMTDNGTATGENVWNAGMRGKKISLYDGGHRVPFFIRWPNGDLRKPQDAGALTHCQDVLPTLIELCGLDRPKEAEFDGISLAHLLRGETDSLPDRMLVAQFSRMNRPRPRPGDSTVMWNKWRLVGNDELYDITDDPGQTNNVIAAHPSIARQMKKHYSRWWSGVEPRVHDFSPIHIGSDKEPLTMLTACDWQDTFLDQQYQVRRGEKKNGRWSVFVEQPGRYEFALARWPYEADTPIRDGLPRYHGVDGQYPEGAALPISAARIQIGDFVATVPVSPPDKAAVFEVPLNEGRADLVTYFHAEDFDELCGAYYVYIRRLGSN